MNGAIEPDAVVTISIETKLPVSLGDLASSLAGYQDQFSQFYSAKHPDREDTEARLLVKEVRTGSIIFDVVPALLPIITGEIEHITTAVDFIKTVAKIIGPWMVKGGRNPDASTRELESYHKAITTIAKDHDGKLSLKARYLKKDGEVETRSEFAINTEQARVVQDNIAAERAERKLIGQTNYQQVVMTLHQASLDAPKVGKVAGEKGVIESISEKPLKLLYASETAGQRIKHELREDGNPLKKAFIVDVNVETARGAPQAYRITHVHSVEDAA